MNREKESIVKALRVAGYTARQVSIRTGGSTYYATVRDPAVDLAKVNEIMARHESIRRDERSGEILGGANTYCHVETAPAVDAAYAAPYIEPIKSAITKLDPDHPTQGIPIDVPTLPEDARPYLWYMYQRPGRWLEITYDHKRLSLYADSPSRGAADLGMIIEYPDMERL